MNLDRKYLISALSYAIVGMCVGIIMAISKNHSVHVAHAHILLVGFVVSFIYGIIHKLWLSGAKSVIGRVQFVLHHIGAITMFIGLLLLYGNVYPEALLAPFLGTSSVTVLIAALMMMYMAIKSEAAKT